MIYRLDVQRRALEELSGILEYYIRINPEIAARFESATESAFDILLELPYGRQIIKGTTRRLNIKGFPYALLYAIEVRETNEADVVIVSCVHQRSNPEDWPVRPE